MKLDNHSSVQANGLNGVHPLLRIEQEIGNGVQELVPLFERYRMEFGHPPNERCVKSFLSDRIYFRDSVIYTAYLGEVPVAFVQLYPFYSLRDLSKQWIVNDLYVLPEFRLRGIGKALLQEVCRMAEKSKSSGVLIQVPAKTASAQSFCESVGLRNDQDAMYFTYKRADKVNSSLQQKKLS